MAMTLPIAIPATPSAGNSPASDDSSNPPRTPNSPSNMQTLALPPAHEPTSAPQPAHASNAGSSQMKRKPSRRANTAERRATHNAVERQRRETLNGRFLDLAALLPNLSQIRRPSKSSIVNSSIAHIHASRRHRLLASRELRLVKLESDALRRELNDWRDRASLPRVEEPVRGEGFNMVLSGEVEVIAAIPGDDEEDNGDEYGDDEYGNAGPRPGSADDDMHAAAVSMLKNANANPFAHNLPPNASNLAHILPRPVTHGTPMIAPNPSGVSYENPAMAALYEPAHHGHGGFPPHFLQQAQQSDADKVAAWNAQLYSALGQQQGQQQIMQAQRAALFTPPSSAHGLGNASAAFNDPASQAWLVNFERQQRQFAAMQQAGYGSPDRDDASSVGSGRERPGSDGHGSGYGSPSEGAGSYEMPSTMGEYVQRRSSQGLRVNTGYGPEAMGMMKQGMGSPIASAGAGYPMMM
ncbi:hypothetical protein PLICRDRAFT_598394 [Plicaturopsis crispa FD-325 SS-3]|nr:hypothetical protein PLICRDRAFT_598394 [Plicaturopsis crispa FD-325 SS-3]